MHSVNVCEDLSVLDCFCIMLWAAFLVSMFYYETILLCNHGVYQQIARLVKHRI